MATGLYYYKLVSPYKEDITKNCKLTVNEIDSNFLNLKDVDIMSAELDEKTYSVVLTRNNGDKLVVDLTPILSGAVYDLEVSFENPSEKESGSCHGANIYVTYSTLAENDVKVTKTVPITGLVTTKNIDSILGGGLLSKVVTDGSLTGEGTLNSPLGIKSTEKDRPAIKVIDKTKGEELPEVTTIGKRYITKEYTSEFGYLYNYFAVEQINEKLEAEGRGWRVPTKADWDCLLNSIEPCGKYRNHDSALCHQLLGKYAGTKLKSECGWLEEPDCECKATQPFPGQTCNDTSATTEPTGDEPFDADGSVVDPNDATPEEVRADYWGVDEYGMRILPTGYGDGEELEGYFNKRTAFWTTTHVYNDLGQDLYVKQFEWDKSGVVQEAWCPDAMASIRLVKDYTGGNYQEAETIDGDNYRTILFPECGTIWTASNFAGTNYPHKEANMGQNPYNRVVYFINVWNGKEWEKRMLTEGESIVIMEENEYCQYNVEYRVFMADDCNQILVNVDDLVVMRVLERLMPLIDDIWEALRKEIQDRIDADEQEREERIAADEQEKDEREAADAILQEEIDAEAARAQEVEAQLWQAINDEAQAREEVDQQLWQAINDETARAQNVEGQLWQAINDETARAQDVEGQLWQGIAQEAHAREEVDNQLWEAINNETNRAQEVEGQLWKAINDEAAAREEVDHQLWEAIENEARAREEIDNQIWDALNNEIERAKEKEDEIEGQLVDVSKNPYILSVYVPDGEPNMVLESKDGNEEHFIKILLNSDFGTF